jgi:hypothetical protein
MENAIIRAVKETPFLFSLKCYRDLHAPIG